MRRLINKRIVAYLFLFILIVTLNNKNLNKIELPKIDRIEISGLGIENNIKLSKELDLIKKQNLFFLNTKEINKILISHNMIEKFSIFKKYPSTLLIQIKKTKFLAYTKKNDSNYFIGSNKKFIRANYINDKIPFIFGNFTISDFFKFEKEIQNSKFKMEQIKNLFFFKSGRWDIETYSGILIKLPNKKLKESLDLSFTIINDINFENIKMMDLRQNNQIITNG